jgi:hypothetical protein
LKFLGEACPGLSGIVAIPVSKRFNVTALIMVSRNVAYDILESLFLVAQPTLSADRMHGFIDPLIAFAPNFDSTDLTLARRRMERLVAVPEPAGP